MHSRHLYELLEVLLHTIVPLYHMAVTRAYKVVHGYWQGIANGIGVVKYISGGLLPCGFPAEGFSFNLFIASTESVPDSCFYFFFSAMIWYE
jgi:hypothetical protein